MPRQFTSIESIPELVPPELWLPEGLPAGSYAPHAEQHTATTTTPREVAYAFYRESFGLGPERQVLELCLAEEEIKVEDVVLNWGNHIGRTIMKMMLDPNRLVPINTTHALDTELLLARFADPHEGYFFEEFTSLHGVLIDRQAAADEANSAMHTTP